MPAIQGETYRRKLEPLNVKGPGGRPLAAGYGAEPVLKDVDLDVKRGEVVAVLGANGASKSTLMRAIAGCTVR